MKTVWQNSWLGLSQTVQVFPINWLLRVFPLSDFVSRLSRHKNDDETVLNVVRNTVLLQGAFILALTPTLYNHSNDVASIYTIILLMCIFFFITTLAMLK